ncbi:hypothetical protein ACWEWL_00615 [Streptomyces rochei]|uniref:hypothetical protein n=1 Tax=Streptomyces TaxID=1883 RepID=UPI000FB9BC5E|nr:MULTISPECIES: hypothetical protein [Streptomyces]RSS75995.1 hypothetical protein EF911_07890 [Streptomyces sp. WAC06128]GGY84215.1 hypothetical protein GCM10010385_38030 [Streptomyces geysiriensis]GHC43830.1 hypothetical protein GCM10010308_73830 [Streptomyces vinaceusdrappus]
MRCDGVGTRVRYDAAETRVHCDGAGTRVRYDAAETRVHYDAAETRTGRGPVRCRVLSGRVRVWCAAGRTPRRTAVTGR